MYFTDLGNQWFTSEHKNTSHAKFVRLVFLSFVDLVTDD